MINNLKATKRDSKTAGEIKGLRLKGFIPAILYVFHQMLGELKEREVWQKK